MKENKFGVRQLADWCLGALVAGMERWIDGKMDDFSAFISEICGKYSWCFLVFSCFGGKKKQEKMN
jgi:hypothetical protein